MHAAAVQQRERPDGHGKNQNWSVPSGADDDDDDETARTFDEGRDVAVALGSPPAPRAAVPGSSVPSADHEHIESGHAAINPSDIVISRKVRRWMQEEELEDLGPYLQEAAAGKGTAGSAPVAVSVGMVATLEAGDFRGLGVPDDLIVDAVDGIARLRARTGAPTQGAEKRVGGGDAAATDRHRDATAGAGPSMERASAPSDTPQPSMARHEVQRGKRDQQSPRAGSAPSSSRS